MAGPTKLPVSPYCKHLRSKKWFFLQGPALTEDDILDASNDCWCEATFMKLGPDGDVVEPEGCKHGRACFEQS